MKIELSSWNLFDALSDMGFDADSTYTKPANKAIHAELAKLVSPEGMAELERLAKFLGQQSGPVTIESLPR